jgi:hypothetical protein
MRSSRKRRVGQPGNRGQIPEVDLATIQTLHQENLRGAERPQFHPCVTFCQMIWLKKHERHSRNGATAAEKPQLAGF